MYATATIEPRLIALLNDSPPEPFVLSHLDLPPLQDLSALKALGRPPALEPKADTRREKTSALVVVQQVLPFDRDLNHGVLTKVPKEGLIKTISSERALGGTSPQSLHKILDDVDCTQPTNTKKRQRALGSKDEFVQLPQPPKKQKTVKQVVPPIIIGLFEPPPNAALFPPISSSAFHDSHGRNSLNVAPSNGIEGSVPGNIRVPKKPMSGTEDIPIKKPSSRIRKKWTEKETTDMLLGVKKHGLGNWTKILRDNEFRFDGRRAVDLKDRFRTCCPTEFRGSKSCDLFLFDNRECASPTEIQSDLPPMNLLGQCGYLSSEDSYSDERSSSEPRKSRRQSRTHRKNIEDLAEIGIREPFKRSQRRVRRPFSEEEDRNILRGFEEYGPSWTSIQKDPRFKLGARRPTDLRDRLRNKYPTKYRPEDDVRIESNANVFSTIDLPKVELSHTHTLSLVSESHDRAQTHHQSVLQDLNLELKASAHLPLTTFPSKDMFADILEQQSTTETPEALQFSQSFDWGENVPLSGSLGDMDISRILLD